MSDSPPLRDRPPTYWRAECAECGRSRSADRDDMFRFLRGPWPACCGVAMTFRVVDADPPQAGPAD